VITWLSVVVALACKLYDRELDQSVPPWHFSRFYADRAFAQVKKQLDSYKITETDWPVLVERSYPVGRITTIRKKAAQLQQLGGYAAGTAA